ncbi:hypothetical protein CHELA40_14897 [Chelatococcus asaccharovorans]|nr:hypothetical protein CHELA17_60725 [Chelatococcus asaccharovorans]CAH1680627.1 hypothetical protein CHELA40_14897 [Chelatococcus asaccharovorans]
MPSPLTSARSMSSTPAPRMSRTARATSGALPSHRTGRSPAAKSSQPRPSGCSTACASIPPAISGRARATASTAIIPTAPSSARSTCRKSWPICASAGQNAIGSIFAPQPRSTLSILGPRARCGQTRRDGRRARSRRHIGCRLQYIRRKSFACLVQILRMPNHWLILAPQAQHNMDRYDPDIPTPQGPFCPDNRVVARHRPRGRRSVCSRGCDRRYQRRLR